MTPPALFIGASYPVVMAWIGAASPGRVIAAVGRAGALNTAGNIAGAILGGFLLVPLVGSLAAVQLLAGVALALSALALAAAERRRGPAVALAAATALFAVQPHGLDYTRLASGANVYFAAQSHYGQVIDHAESQDGGLTTVAESRDRGGARVVTMQTNGKFQGNDSHTGEMTAQVSFTLIPLLHTAAREAALVIGLGTGVSARVASDAGFAKVHVAELARDVVDLADRHFRGVNGGVLSRPGTTLHITDGRNLLALSPRRYDLVSMEVTSIWFAGAAALYNREFYEVARARLTERGVLQQWVQLHRLSRVDVLSILATARSVFPSVWLYFAPNQGVLVACAWDCRPSEATVGRLAATPMLAADLAFVGGVARLLDERLLGPAEVDRLIESSREWGLAPEDLVSTDDNLFLEYSTPRGNVRPYGPSLEDNLAFVGRLRPASAEAGTALSEGAVKALRARLAPPAPGPR
jgi:spermidine synthase